MIADTTQPADPAVAPNGPPLFGWREVLRVYLITVSFGLMIAVMLSLWSPGEFWRNLLFSESIALWAASLSMGLRYAPGIRRLPKGTAFVVCLVPSIPLAYLFGHMTARALLGELGVPVRNDHMGSLTLVMTAFATIFVTYVVWLRQRLTEEAAARTQAQRLALEAELRMLRAQLEPHMLFNTLANLRSLVDEDPREAQRMLDLLIVYLRSALASSRSEQTTLQGEFEQLRAYLEIMSLRLGDRLRYTLALPAALQQQPVPPMLLQPLVENAIRHGIEPVVGGGSIVVEARRGEAGVEIRVVDSGAGLPAEAADLVKAARPRPGYGLHHVRERLLALYGPAGSLQLGPARPSGTEALVRIPT